MNRDETLKEIRERLDHMADNELAKVHKMTKPVSREDIVNDIIKHSKTIRPDSVRRF